MAPRRTESPLRVQEQMSRPVTLEYEKHAPPNRYEWEMESERARWLRRRFLWFTGTLVVVAVVLLIVSVVGVFSTSGMDSSAAAVDGGFYLVQIGAAGTAWWYARRRTRNERRLFAMAFWLVVGLGVFGIFAKRVSTELSFMEQLNRLENRQEMRVSAPGVRLRGDSADLEELEEMLSREFPVSPKSAAPPVLTPSANMLSGIRQGISLWTLWHAVFISHLLACLFLPWTVREATKPAMLLLAAAAVLVIGDVLMGRGSIWYLGGAIVLLPLTVLPGIGWSWWRYSRFRRNFRSVFESNQLRQLTYELTGARRIHESSLPPVIDRGPLRLSYIYEPMSQIGGDVLFVHPRPPEHQENGEHRYQDGAPARQMLVLLDVTGHGIAAALTVNRLVGELERIFAENAEIGSGELMEALNKYVFLTLATHGVFVTGVAIRGAISGDADTSASYTNPHDVTFASAGHPTAFIRRANGQIEPLDSNATMLGVLPPEEYISDERIFTLEPSDAIVAYTDGAIEARNLEDEMIGIDGVRDLVQSIGGESLDPSHWPEHLIRRVAAWRNGPPADDTLIACVYRPAVPAELSEPKRERARSAQPAMAAAS